MKKLFAQLHYLPYLNNKQINYNQAKNTGGTSVSASTPHSNQTRDASKGSSGNGNYGNRGRHSNRALPHHPQHQPDDR